jgi:hypothetical protein
MSALGQKQTYAPYHKKGPLRAALFVSRKCRQLSLMVVYATVRGGIANRL